MGFASAEIARFLDKIRCFDFSLGKAPGIAPFSEISTLFSRWISTFYPRLNFMLHCYFLVRQAPECNSFHTAGVLRNQGGTQRPRGSARRREVLGFPLCSKGLPVDGWMFRASARGDRSDSQKVCACREAPSGADRRLGSLRGPRQLDRGVLWRFGPVRRQEYPLWICAKTASAHLTPFPFAK